MEELQIEAEVHEPQATQDHTAQAEVPAPHAAHAAADAHGGEGLHPVEWPMFFWFLAVFLVAGYILKKYAWQPILDGLDGREAEIRQSLDDAERIRQEMADLDNTRQQTVAEADGKAKEIVEGARKAATEASRVIQSKARDEAVILMENARREINTARDQAAASLRTESVDLAVNLAEKILQEQLDDERRQTLTDRMIREV